MPPFALNDRSANLQPLYWPYSSELIARDAQIVNRSSVAALTFIVWDILITFDDEVVKYIWARTWSYMKITYFLIRYLPVLVQISILFIGSELTPHFHFTPHDCFIWQVYQGVATVIITASVDAVLILRVYALYHGNNKIRRIVGIFFLFEIAGMIAGLPRASWHPVRQRLSEHACTNVASGLCVSTTLRCRHLRNFVLMSNMVYRASSIIPQFLLFGLTLAKFIEALRAGWGDIPLIKLFVRDGTWAFFLLFCVFVGQLMLYVVKSHDYVGVLFGWLLTAFSFCGYRILINLQRLGERKQGASGSGLRSRNRRMGTDSEYTTATAPFTSNFELSGMSADGERIFETYQK